MRSLLAAGLFAAITACSTTPESAQRAGEIARAIDKEPDRAEAILQEHGLSVEELEALMFEIAEDPELSAAYEAVRSE